MPTANEILQVQLAESMCLAQLVDEVAIVFYFLTHKLGSHKRQMSSTDTNLGGIQLLNEPCGRLRTHNVTSFPDWEQVSTFFGGLGCTLASSTVCCGWSRVESSILRMPLVFHGIQCFSSRLYWGNLICS